MAGYSNDKTYWTSDQGIAVISQWKRDGLTNKDVTEKLGIGMSTLYRWMEDSGKLREALKLNREIANSTLENKAVQMALEGNTAMMIFLLKNRMPSKYAEVSTQNLNMNTEALDELKELSKKLIEDETK